MKIKFITIATLLFFLQISFGQKGFEKMQQSFAENITRTFLNCNNISTVFHGDGISDIHRSGAAGFEYPKGTRNYAIYATGFMWGAYIEGDPQVKVSGTKFISLLQPGKILEDGSPDDPKLPNYRIYRVRNDIFPRGPIVDLSSEMKDERDTYDNIRTKYETDWNEWPADDGAPFIDNNSNGIYEPEFDTPGVENAKQTIWYVVNDLTEVLFDISPTHRLLGIEMQVTIWGYDNQPVFSNMLFRKHKLINKSENEFKDMYVSIWSDADIGWSGNDVGGTDTVNNMVYTYNLYEYDHEYQNMTPPAVGFQLLQGPLLAGKVGEDRNKNNIDDAVDYAIYNNKLVGPGFINLPMTASYFPIEYEPGVRITDADGANKRYLFFQGINAHTEEPYIDPITGNETVYPYSGDPLTQTGWVDIDPYDERVALASGPFNMAPGDTQEVVTGHLAAMGSNHLESVNLLKYYANKAQNAYSNLNLPKTLPAPPGPEVSIKSTIDGILIEWDLNTDLFDEIENFNSQGYNFQGYNLYQVEGAYSGFPLDNKIAVFDIVDGITTIHGEIRDTLSGFPIQGIAQEGADSGIKRSILISSDTLQNSLLIKGKEYTFGVSSYSYNNSEVRVKSTESAIHYETITYLEHLSGSNYRDEISYSHQSGTGDEDFLNLRVIQPASLTGDQYEVFFTKDDNSMYWNLRNVTTGSMVLKNQTVMDGIDIYTNENTTNPIVDGFEINLKVNYDLPNHIKDATLNSREMYYSIFNSNFYSNTNDFRISDSYLAFGPQDTIAGIPSDSFGTNDTSLLSLDYEIVFDGTMNYSYRVTSGGQLATLYGAKNYDIADHPANPNPGSSEPFTIRVPFKVKTISDQKRINLIVYDFAGNPEVDDPFRTWNNMDGMHTYFIVSDYSFDPLDIESEEVRNAATHDMIWYYHDWEIGDTLKVFYQNPTTTSDKYIFTAPPRFNKEDFRAPDNFELFHNYPNPFNPNTTIKFQLPKPNVVKLEIFNILGQRMRTLANEYFEAGTHYIQFNGSGLSSGVYFYSIESGNYFDVKKMLLLK
jgi:hypothetical protein